MGQVPACWLGIGAGDGLRHVRLRPPCLALVQRGVSPAQQVIDVLDVGCGVQGRADGHRQVGDLEQVLALVA